MLCLPAEYAPECHSTLKADFEYSTLFPAIQLLYSPQRRKERKGFFFFYRLRAARFLHLVELPANNRALTA
jgi:hypothetical protein